MSRKKHFHALFFFIPYLTQAMTISIITMYWNFIQLWLNCTTFYKICDFGYSAERQKNRMSGSMSNLSMNGHMLDISKINGSMTDDALSSRLRAELDRSIAKHLEAGKSEKTQVMSASQNNLYIFYQYFIISVDLLFKFSKKYWLFRFY